MLIMKGCYHYGWGLDFGGSGVVELGLILSYCRTLLERVTDISFFTLPKVKTSVYVHGHLKIPVSSYLHGHVG